MIIAVTGNTTAFALADAPKVSSFAAGQNQRIDLTSAKAEQQKTTSEFLQLLESASTTSKSLADIPKNATVTVTETRGDWSRISYKAMTGWVPTDSLGNEPTSKAKVYNYTTKYTTLRKDASTESERLGTHERRTKVEYLGKSGAFSKVGISGKTGYIQTSHLSKDNPKAVYRWSKKEISIHKDPSDKTPRISRLKENTRVEWLRNSGDWQRVKSSSGHGWVRSASVANNAVQYRWTKSNVNLRKGTSTSHGSRGLIPGGEKVAYLKTSKGWSQVKSSKGTGWIKNSYLTATKTKQYPVAVYGTLRKGQKAYRLVKGKTSSEVKTKVVSHNLFLRRDLTWLSYMVPSKDRGHLVVAERMTLKTGSYASTLAALDRYERFDPRKPMANQSYNRKLVKDQQGNQVWAYVGSAKMSKYLTKSGIRVKSGDYLKRY
ncbi:SH3 domain-containing protein [Paeniglutamicibacter kerguelensis]|uniref:SH3-like domain-containing protein n=1 Tax=Paeniglutamicibacter kerguelensis TaxID=254788 RepID=A0ABS4XGL9_9MICC|nr:SH3-like domain-containing protein [Paeniglutamicibacter kerguelensis]